jgi:hypothetical protein
LLKTPDRARGFDDHGQRDPRLTSAGDRVSRQRWKADVGPYLAIQKIARMRGFVSPRLEIRFEPLEGQDNLTIIGRNGQPFITPQEMSRRRALAERRAENAALRADNAERRAENAALRAENAELRAEQYAAKLRELGIETD